MDNPLRTPESVHSHLLFILSTSYLLLIIFIFIGGLKTFEVLGGDTSGKTAEELGEQIQAILVLISFALHCAALVCTIICILFNNIPKIRVKMPTIVVVVILIFAASFNAIAAILLFIHKPKDEQQIPVMRAAAIVSSIATMFAIGLLALFYKRIPKGQQKLQRMESIPVQVGPPPGPPPPPPFMPPPPPQSPLQAPPSGDYFKP
ncbi:unnamed protein product [Cylicocyclus nassatus]|uniref:Uncharacterized protein n=1 Tax=Cylicocyclus nassatus TaxID=53992 RepID=A0AA36DMK2_CYLNA|nr:unnamed protein product [Cylicocyclus nassatus]